VSRYALSLNKTKPFFSSPPSNLSYKSLALNGIQSDEARVIQSTNSKTDHGHQKLPGSSIQTFPCNHKNFRLPHPAVAASSSKGFSIQIDMPSMASAQLLNFTSLTL
jgi:hypothetical protein